MAAGEYVSVQSQADLENADIRKEINGLTCEARAGIDGAKGIYKARGLNSELALEVAKALTAHNALEAHLRDELGIVQETRAAPVLAALSSAGSFVLGASLPCLSLLFPVDYLMPVTAAISLLCLLVLGGWGAHMGSAHCACGVARIDLGLHCYGYNGGAGFALGRCCVIGPV